MKCPFCSSARTRVIDKRATNDGLVNRRRRICLSCQNRFTTYERVQDFSLTVIKRDGREERFNKDKLFKGIAKACEKTSVSSEEINMVVREVELYFLKSGRSKVSSEEVGRKVLSELKELDEIAYLRFASVYRRFNSINSFEEELEKIKKSRGIFK